MEKNDDESLKIQKTNPDQTLTISQGQGAHTGI